jgi:phenylacetate-coenzyme A ligase PaaK-like adenylate-forming protein
MNTENYIKKIFKIVNDNDFNTLALELFLYQYKYNEIYQEYINLIKYDISKITYYTDIPFLPIELFKTKKVISKYSNFSKIFYSSGTTGNIKSKHYIIDEKIYQNSIINSFKLFFGNPKKYVFLCLVPSTQEEPNSSLSYMCSELIKASTKEESGFYLNQEKSIIDTIYKCKKKNQPIILIGLSFAILDFAEKNKIDLTNEIVIETGGMKNKRQSIVRPEIHKRLKLLLNVTKIYSEYSMTELLSQSYFCNESHFNAPPWKKILIREKNNPLKLNLNNNRGCINIIDLANLHTCGFIATNDLGVINKDGFDVLGRAQNASERGCNLMI